MGLLDREYMHPDNCVCPKCLEAENKAQVMRSLLKQIEIDEYKHKLQRDSEFKEMLKRLHLD